MPFSEAIKIKTLGLKKDEQATSTCLSLGPGSKRDNSYCISMPDALSKDNSPSEAHLFNILFFFSEAWKWG